MPVRRLARGVVRPGTTIRTICDAITATTTTDRIVTTTTASALCCRVERLCAMNVDAESGDGKGCCRRASQAQSVYPASRSFRDRIRGGEAGLVPFGITPSAMLRTGQYGF